MIIGVDLDDTWMNWSQQYDLRLDELTKHLPGIPRSKDRISFDLWSGRTDEEKTAILNIMNETGFYESLEPLPGAVETYHEMRAEGHEVIIASSPWYTNPTCMDDKARSVLKHFGQDALDNMVLTKKKHRLILDVLFDDKPEIEKADEAMWAQVLVDGPHNRHSSLIRLTDWRDWRALAHQAIIAKSEAVSKVGVA